MMMMSSSDGTRDGSSDSGEGGIGMDYGILISFTDNNDNDNDKEEKEGRQCQVAFCGDANYPTIHPNVYAPNALANVKKLGGGGSGVAVFSGEHPKLGSLVMKHGGYKDMVEFFSLATIAQELKYRGAIDDDNNNKDNTNKPLTAKAAAARDMQRRIPEFKMIYISPYHFRSRGAELWTNLKQIIRNWSLFTLPGVMGSDSNLEEGGGENDEKEESTKEDNGTTTPSSKSKTPRLSNSLTATTMSGSFRNRRRSSGASRGARTPSSSLLTALPARQECFSATPPPLPPPTPIYSPRVPGTNVRPSMIIRQVNPHGLNFGRSIRLYEGDDEDFSFQVDGNCESVALVFAKDSCDFLADGRTVQLRGPAYPALKTLVDELLPLMTDQLFKFTLGQKTIGGGKNPLTGNQLLYAGLLHGELLDTLITQMIQVIRNLQQLTLPEEVDVVEFVRAEVAQFEAEESIGSSNNDNSHNISSDYGNFLEASDVSLVSDTFVGNAIRKNFHPTKGRTKLLEALGTFFRERPKSLILTAEEEVPAFHLGVVLQPGALMGDTFENVPHDEPTVLQPDNYFWRNILRHAVEHRPGQSTASLQRIWTCGLADAGLHNLFLSQDTVWLFDLGEPQLQSLPGFLTKFFFSFFHTLGMQEHEEIDPKLEDPLNNSTSPSKDWVRRFVPTCDNDGNLQKLALTEETVDLLPKAYHAFEVALDRIIDEVFDGDDSLRWLLIQYVTLQLLSDTAFCLQRWQIKGGGKDRNMNHNKGIEKWLWRALWDIYVAYDINTRSSWSRFRVVEPCHPSTTATATTATPIVN
jgi:hypothetical protein